MWCNDLTLNNLASNQMEMENNLVKGVILESPDRYVPVLVPVEILKNKYGYPLSAHRLDGRGGAYLFSRYDQQNTKFVELTEEEVSKIIN